MWVEAVGSQDSTYEAVRMPRLAATKAEENLIHVLWINAVLSVPKRGWMNGMGGCPNVGGICIGCTMPGFPNKFMPVMDEPPGGKLSTTAVGLYGKTIRTLRKVTQGTLDKEPRWRTTGSRLTTGATRTW